jgi:hypothetical protein
MKAVRFNGWGISLCWWVNVEYPKSVKDKLIELLFGGYGLRLNIVRYNLGRGSIISICYKRRCDILWMLNKY